jgi:hypothetical protein
MTPTTAFPAARPLVRTLVLVVAAAGLAACSDSDGNGPEIEQKDFAPDSLDSLAPDEPAPAAAPTAPEPTVIDQSAPASEPTEAEREWERERQSQTNYGRTRDRVKTLTNTMQDGSEAEEGLAAVTPDEEWVGTGGAVWDMPSDWRMAVPASGRFGEMLVPSPLGAALAVFTRESGTVAELERQVSGMVVGMTGERVSPGVQSFEVAGRPVRLLSLNGSLIDPTAKGGTGEKPFSAVRAAIVDLGEARVLIVLSGPEQTVANNEAKFEAMVRGMHE